MTPVSLMSISPLTIYGACAVTFMVVMYALEGRSRWFILAFAGGCLLSSAYGFLAGAWPFGVVEAIWSLVAVRRFLRVPGAACDPNDRGRTNEAGRVRPPQTGLSSRSVKTVALLFRSAKWGAARSLGDEHGRSLHLPSRK
jgi:hypothetical protein